MSSAAFFAHALLACALLGGTSAQAERPFLCAGIEAMGSPADTPAKALGISGAIVSSRGQLKVLVVFARFKNEKSDASLIPEFTHRLFDPEAPGSFAHFYRTMSFDQLQVNGVVLARRYVSLQPASAYLPSPGGHASYGQFAQEILKQVDAEVDLGQFDNDGPDGIPNSGDDDGAVDYLFLLLHSVPENFIQGKATGIAGLGFGRYYSTHAHTLKGEPVRVEGMRYYGAMLEEGGFAQTVGVMAHEFGHSLGLPDLYDLDYTGPEDDSAGIGKWGLMGQGALGWEGGDGPNPFCAWSLEQLGWIGRNNERLVEVSGDTAALSIADLHQGGVVCKIPLQGAISAAGFYYPEYLLLEQRVRAAQYYNRHLPAEGLLIWQVRRLAGNNSQEEAKLVDLVCADGLYGDAGYPLGRSADPYQGKDNLDFWAHDEVYAAAHGGNLGNAEDPFDGVLHTRFDLYTNPSVNMMKLLPVASTGLALTLQRRGEAMQVEIRQPRWSGVISGAVSWLGEIVVDGDLTVGPEGRLLLYPATRVRVAGLDHLESGLDVTLSELLIQGELRLSQEPLRYVGKRGKIEWMEEGAVVFEALVSGESWYGILSEGSERVQAGTEELILKDATAGMVAVGDQPTAVREEVAAQPALFQLLPNYPNPFNGETEIPYSLSADARAELIICDLAGQQVATLVSGVQPAGLHWAHWQGVDSQGYPLASGVYLCRLQTGTQVETRKLLLLR